MHDLWSNSFVVTIVRHGETDYNLSPVIKSDTEADLPLNSTGAKQAVEVGRRLKSEVFHVAYTSHLKRAEETANTILSHLETDVPELKIDARIRERDMGTLQPGTLVSDWLKAAIMWSFKERKPAIHFNPPGGETYEDLKNRVAEFFEEVYSHACSNHSVSNVLVVSHGIWILSTLDYLLHRSENFAVDKEGSLENASKVVHSTHLKNTCVTKVRISRKLDATGKRRVQLFMFDDHSHLN